MAKNSKKATQQAVNAKSSKGKQAAKAGLGALLVGMLVWLTGGFTRENGLEWLKSIGIAVGLALLIRWPIGEPFRIPSGSMEPTLHGNPKILHGDRVWVNKFVYGVRFPFNRTRIPFTKIYIKYADRRVFRWKEPQRWDIVVFKSVEDGAKHNTLIKRVVGLPGERVHIAHGKVYINGRPLELPDNMPDIHYTSPQTPFGGMTYGILEDDEHALVPEGHYLLLGDNSARSRDGRVWGWAPNEHILGRAACTWWPPSRWRDFTGFSKTWWWRTIVIVLGVLFFVRLLFGRSWRARPTTEEGEKVKADHLYVNRWTFGPPIPFTRRRLFQGRAPHRGELVLYYCPPNENDHGRILLGRVAALPGERVYLDNGKLTINDTPLDAPASLVERAFPADEDTGPYGRSKGKQHSLVPQDHFFILADQAFCDHAVDSRSVGWVPRTHLIGAATTVWWPPTHWRRVR